jgi:membrane dipeptidase
MSAMAASAGQTKAQSVTVEDRAAALHRSAIVIDGMAVKGEDPPELVGGLTAKVITLATRFGHDTTYALREFSTQLDFIDFYSDRLKLIRTAEDIRAAKREGKLGVIFNFQCVEPFGSDLSLVRVFQELGLRSMQLTYMENSRAGSGCLETNDLGLTSWGRQLIRAMERCGVLLDLAHVGRRTSMDALSYARRPVVFSHCNPATLYECPRSITDDEIKACAATGGVVGVTPSSDFYAPPGAPRPTISDWVTHISYVAELVGIDHVAVCYEVGTRSRSAFAIATHFGREFGDNFGGGLRPWGDKRVAGGESRGEFPRLTLELAKRGFSDEDILKVIGANWLRVYEATWVPSPARVQPSA